MEFAIPRPRGRGPIEAELRRAQKLVGRHQFRDRAVAAPLKRAKWDADRKYWTKFRDRAVAAPLKLYQRLGALEELIEFRDRAVAAPLKPAQPFRSFAILNSNSATARSRPH